MAEYTIIDENDEIDLDQWSTENSDLTLTAGTSGTSPALIIGVNADTTSYAWWGYGSESAPELISENGEELDLVLQYETADEGSYGAEIWHIEIVGYDDSDNATVYASASLSKTSYGPEPVNLTGDPMPAGERIAIRIDARQARSGNELELSRIELTSSVDHSGPGPGPEPDYPDEIMALSDKLAPRVAAYIGRAGDADIVERARWQVPLVVMFVDGYVNGNGMGSGNTLDPKPALQAVIVSAASRLASNPEQNTQVSIGSYSASPAKLTAFTLAEIGILHRYRRRSA